MITIAACIDFSPLTQGILQEARKLARATEGTIHLIHVTGGKPELPSSVVHDASLEEEGHKRTREIRNLMNLRDDLADEGFSCTASTPAGPVSQAIAAEALHSASDYIIMGSHGNGAMYHLVVGSVAEGVLKSTGIPVILVPGKAEDAQRRA